MRVGQALGLAFNAPPTKKSVVDAGDAASDSIHAR